MGASAPNRGPARVPRAVAAAAGIPGVLRELTAAAGIPGVLRELTAANCTDLDLRAVLDFALGRPSQ